MDNNEKMMNVHVARSFIINQFSTDYCTSCSMFYGSLMHNAAVLGILLIMFYHIKSKMLLSSVRPNIILRYRNSCL